MALAFRKSLRGIFASVRGTVMDSPDDGLDDPMKKILGHQHATTWADVAFSNIIKCSDGHSLLSALQSDYRICRAGHFKQRQRRVLQNVAEHEFIIVHLRHQGKTTFFRIDRSIGPRSDKEKASSANSSESGSEVSVPSRTPSRSSSSRSSSSMESILMYPARLVNYCVCRLSNITSSRHWARDTIVQVQETPSKGDTYELTTIEFTGLSNTWPSLWDLVHIVQFLNQQCEEYNVIDAQCYWYADMVSGILEEWCSGTKVTRHEGWQGTKSKTLLVPAPGTFKGVPIYKRDEDVLRSKKTVLIDAIKVSTKSTLEFLDLKRGANQISADAEEQIQGLSRQLGEAELRAKNAEDNAEARVSEMSKQMKDADARVSEMAKQMKEVEKRAEARVSEMARQMKDVEERAVAQVRGVEERAEAKIQDLSAQLQRSQDLLTGFEARASARDELMERIMARLEERLPKSGNGHSIIA